MVKVTMTVFDTADVEESGNFNYELKGGVCVRRYRLKRSCSEQGIEVSADVADIQGCRNLLGQLFEIAGIGKGSLKAARD